MVKKNKPKLFRQTKIIILIFVSLALLMFISALVELQQSKKELFQLMEAQSHSLLEALSTASRNTLLTNNYLEEISRKRLLNNANLIEKLYEKGQLSDSLLHSICLQNDIYRINVINRNGKKLFSSHKPIHFLPQQKQQEKEILKPIFEGRADTLIIGLKRARLDKSFRYAVAIAAKGCGAIVLNINAQQFLNFKKNIGFGALLRSVAADNPKIIYTALQDTASILSASGNVRVLEGILKSPFLTRSLRDSLFLTRTTSFDSLEIFEAVHPFAFKHHTIGLLRVGLSMEAIHDINRRLYRRLIIITIVLVILGSFMFIFIFTRQKFFSLQKDYQVVETYSGNIISNVSDAIIVLDRQSGIKIFNKAAEELFNVKYALALGQPPDYLFRSGACPAILEEASLMQQVHCHLGGQEKFLLITKSFFTDKAENENIILVIRDLTEQKMLEEQMEREKRLTAMGELASGVAHEIRNPLNTIGTIVQQLDSDFEPQKERQEYHELAQLVYSEVKRINKTVQDFLRFARPETVQGQSFSLGAFFTSLKKQYEASLKQKNIDLTLDMQWQGTVKWDPNQMKQALINIIQNAAEAICKNGRITILVKAFDADTLELKIADSGPGMSESIRKNIFNLYFTTKAQGSGIGLSIVQRIIFEHRGLINMDSRPGQGTVFTIRIPKEV